MIFRYITKQNYHLSCIVSWSSNIFLLSFLWSTVGLGKVSWAKLSANSKPDIYPKECIAVHCSVYQCNTVTCSTLPCCLVQCIEANSEAEYYRVRLLASNYSDHSSPSKLVQITDCPRHSWHINSNQTQQNSCHA